jgi:hypothetical protein
MELSPKKMQYSPTKCNLVRQNDILSPTKCILVRQSDGAILNQQISTTGTTNI